jgi:hypothetical protein
MKSVANILFFALIVGIGFATAGPLDPDCTAQKAAKSATMKATVGVGGRCSPKEAAADTAKRKTGIDQDRKDKDDKGPLGRDKNGK